MDIFEGIITAIGKGDAPSVAALTRDALAKGIPAEDILNKGYLAGMNIVGRLFKANEIFIPEVLIAAQAMKAGMAILKPILAASKVKSAGKIVIGTVQGDLHDIGKNIVSMLLEGAGFEVIDLGCDVSKQKFVETVEKESPDILGMSALLTTTMTYMRDIIQCLESAGVRKAVKVIVGGAPVTQTYADEIAADGYARDAASAVELVRSLVAP